MDKIELKATNRKEIGTKKAGSLRRSGFLPAVLYGHGFDSSPLSIDINEFERVYKKAGESTLVYLNVDGQTHPTIIHDVAKDPVTERFLHADFYKVRLDEKIKTKIPVVLAGESPIVKSGNGILVKNINELEVEALPQDLPGHIEVNISGLNIVGDHIRISDLIMLDKIKIGGNPEDIIVLIQAPRSEEEIKEELEAVTPTAEEVEVIKKEKEAVEEITPVIEAKPSSPSPAEKKK